MEEIRFKFTNIRSIRLLSIIFTILIVFLIAAFIILPFKQAIIVFCCLMVFLLPCVFFMFFLNISKDYLIITEDGIYIKGQLIKWNQIKKIYKTGLDDIILCMHNLLIINYYDDNGKYHSLRNCNKHIKITRKEYKKLKEKIISKNIQII